jgi:hypothetical protein
LGYDVEFVRLPSTAGLKFPVDATQTEKLLKEPAGIGEPSEIRALLLSLPGAKPGPEDTIDYIGAGLNYARLAVKPDRIHIENNCGPKELLKIHEHLSAKLQNLLIHDLQSGQLHTAESLKEWWSKPL